MLCMFVWPSLLCAVGGVGVWGCGPLMMLCVRALFEKGSNGAQEAIHTKTDTQDVLSTCPDVQGCGIHT